MRLVTGQKQSETWMRAARFIAAFAMSFPLTPKAYAAVPKRFDIYNSNDRYTTSEFVRRDGEVAELDLTYIKELSERARTELRMSVADVLPTDMKASESESRVAQQILSHSLERWFDTSPWAKDTFGDTVKAVEEPFGKGMTMEDESGQTHKLQVKMKAARTLASINYTGWVNASLGYQVSSGTVAFEVSHKVAQNQKISFNHSSNNEESRQIVAYQIDF
jgi:hypothetical protein